MKALVFDSETTGLINNHIVALDKQPEVIEFYGALVNLKTKKKLKEWEFIIRPRQYPMTKETIEKTKTQLSNELLKDAPLFPKVKAEIRKALEQAPLIIAHNLSFDKEMIDIEYERLGEKLKWPRGICTVEATIHLKGFRLALDALHQLLFKETFKDAHRAKPDTNALIRCCYELHKRGLI